MPVTTTQIKPWAQELGFDLIGIAPAQPPEHAESMPRWLERGFHGDMHYLTRHFAQRTDPTQLVPGAKSIICTALSYFRPTVDHPDHVSRGRVARYAWGRDYHDIMRDKLKLLADRITTQTPAPVLTRCFVDTAPLLEKAHAARAGLGWIGKNTLLINERFGSWLVLGEIVTDLELTYDKPVESRCGPCRRCLDACPTQAFADPFLLDARRCISYLTVESQSELPPDLASRMADRLFGCDACQETCPFNQHPAPGWAYENEPHPPWSQLDLAAMKDLTEPQFQAHFAGSSILRGGYRHFMHLVANFRQNKK